MCRGFGEQSFAAGHRGGCFSKATRREEVGVWPAHRQWEGHKKMEEQNGLQAFLKEKAASGVGGEPEVDWGARKRKWLANIDQLYGLIEQWLAPLVGDGTVKVLKSSVHLTEDYIGSYDVDVLAIIIGKQRVAFHPKAALIVGAQGRVDVRGPRAIRSLIVEDDTWSILERQPRLKTLPFNEDSFRDVLGEVME